MGQHPQTKALLELGQCKALLPVMPLSLGSALVHGLSLHRAPSGLALPQQQKKPI